MRRRYLATLTEYNHQLRSGLVVELVYRDDDWFISDIIDMSTLIVEPAGTVYLQGTLRGDVRVGARARNLQLDDLQLDNLQLTIDN